MQSAWHYSMKAILSACGKIGAGETQTDIMQGNVTGGTIVQMAKEHGWAPEKGRELAWDDTIQKDPAIIVDSHYIETLEIHEPADWKPDKELIR